MNKITSWFRRVFTTADPVLSAAQLPEEVLVQTSLVIPAPASELDQDWARYRSELELSDYQRHPFKQELKKKYSKDALNLLFKHLDIQPGASSKETALQNLEDACRQVNEVYPLNWKVASSAVRELGSTTCYMLIGHSVWLNPNGAYCIRGIGHTPLTFCKPASDGSVFVKPQGFDDAGT